MSMHVPEAHSPTVQRTLGDTEISYFLPSRTDGVNDMYLHISFSGPTHVVSQHAIIHIWALLRLKHPLIASRVDFKAYDDLNFV